MSYNERFQNRLKRRLLAKVLPLLGRTPFGKVILAQLAKPAPAAASAIMTLPAA